MLVLCEVSNFVNIVNWKVIEIKQNSSIMYIFTMLLDISENALNYFGK